MTAFEIISLILNAILVFTLVLAVRQININRKQLYLETISNCINSYKEFKNLKSDTEDEELITGYLEMTNTELFYFEKNYLPKEVAIEWIGGMIDFLPITNEKRDVLNQSHCLTKLSSERDKYLRPYHRIKHAFEITGEYNFEVVFSYKFDDRKKRIAERERLVREILSNVHDFDGYTGK